MHAQQQLDPSHHISTQMCNRHNCAGPGRYLPNLLMCHMTDTLSQYPRLVGTQSVSQPQLTVRHLRLICGCSLTAPSGTNAVAANKLCCSSAVAVLLLPALAAAAAHLYIQMAAAQSFALKASFPAALNRAASLPAPLLICSSSSSSSSALVLCPHYCSPSIRLHAVRPLAMSTWACSVHPGYDGSMLRTTCPPLRTLM
jgi:hypothetical protein